MKHNNAMSNPEYESWLQVSAGAANSHALQPCPFCGGKAGFVPRAVSLALQKDPSDPKFGVSVICGKCASESPNMVDEAHAAAKWNSRVPDRTAGVHDADQDSVADWEREQSARNARWLAEQFPNEPAQTSGLTDERINELWESSREDGLQTIWNVRAFALAVEREVRCNAGVAIPLKEQP